MSSSAMDIIEAPAEEPGSCVRKSLWLQSTISGVDEKMKAILNILDDNESPLQNAGICLRKKETIKKVVEDLCASYCSLAEKYDNLKSVAIDARNTESSPPSGNRFPKNREPFVTSDNSQLETTDSNPESTVEDADIECEGATVGIEHIKRFGDSLAPKEGSSSKPKKARFDGVKFKFSKLVEENTQLQVELIRRNSEKRETIIKLQNQVRRLMAENDTLQRTPSYSDRNKQHVHESSPSRKSFILDRFFRGCSP